MKKKVATIATAVMITSSFAANAAAAIYTVQKGDTLSQIAKNYSTSVAELKNLNNLRSDLIFVKQTLKVSNDPSAPSQTAPAKTSAVPQAVKTYKVVKGDTLIKIANQHGISLAELKLWNNIKDHLIYPDQILKVSASAAAPQAPAPAPAASAPAAVNSSTYTVKSGDTLSYIGKQFGVSVQQLKTWNSLSSDLIYIGQKLKLTGQSGTVNQPKQAPTVTKAPQAAETGYSAATLINVAKSYLGTPYVWGGSTPSGFDCSGFIYYVYNKAGKSISRLSTDGYYNRSFYVNQPQPGDLVFFENTYKKGISHMGIYLGNNQFIHTGSSDKGVEISDLRNSYWQEHLDGFKRFY